MKKFCIAGPVDPQRNYFIAKRLNWQQLDTLIDDMQYFSSMHQGKVARRVRSLNI